MKVHELRRELWLPRPVAEIFPFFANAANLEMLTPPWLNFRILSPRPIPMGVGTLIDYRIVVHGIPFRWQSKITVWDPPYRFVDEQQRGPYRIWRHEHRFAERDGGTTISDRVKYAVLFDPIVHRWLVRPDVGRIFDFRTKKICELFHEAIPQLSS